MSEIAPDLSSKVIDQKRVAAFSRVVITLARANSLSLVELWHACRCIELAAASRLSGKIAALASEAEPQTT